MSLLSEAGIGENGTGSCRGDALRPHFDPLPRHGDEEILRPPVLVRFGGGGWR